MIIDRSAKSLTRIRRQLQKMAIESAPEGIWSVSDTQTSAYTADVGELVLANPAVGGFTVTLPTALGKTGRMISVKNVSSSTNTITVDGDGTETIDAASNVTITTAYGSVTVVSDGSNWFTL